MGIGYRFHDLAFAYDLVGNLTSLENRALPPGTFPGPGLGNAIGGPWLKTYAYDDLYRLTSSTGRHTTTPDAAVTYTFSQTYDSIHNITRKTQRNEFKSSVQPHTTYDYLYAYPAAGNARPHGATAIGPFDVTHDANGNHIRTQKRDTGNISQYLFDEENRLSCVNKGQQAPSPACDAQGMTEFVYDHAGIRKRKDASSPTLYPNQYFTDFGGGAGNQFKHVFIGATRLLSKKARPAPDRQHWYFHPDHLGSTSMVTNENGQLAEHIHYFPYGEVWVNELPNSAPVPYLFTAKELDPETGFYDFGARYLDPRFSKWMSADPALGEHLRAARRHWRLHTPPNLALYGYTWNNPAMLRDPNGREPELADPPPPGFFRSIMNSIRSWALDKPVTDPVIVPNRPTWETCPICIAQPLLATPGDELDVGYTVRPITRGDIAGDVLETAAIATLAGGRIFRAGRQVSIEIETATQMNARRGLSARMAQVEFAGHHPFVQFMGGPLRQQLENLTRTLHVEFHRRLVVNLRNAGINLPVGGRRGSAQAWEEAFRRNPGLRDRAIDALRRTSSEFDREFGTALKQGLENGLRTAR